MRIPTEWISPEADVAEVELTFDGDVIVIRPLARRRAGQVLERLQNEVDRDPDLLRELAAWEVPADPQPEPVHLGLDL